MVSLCSLSIHPSVATTNAASYITSKYLIWILMHFSLNFKVSSFLSVKNSLPYFRPLFRPGSDSRIYCINCIRKIGVGIGCFRYFGFLLQIIVRPAFHIQSFVNGGWTTEKSKATIPRKKSHYAAKEWNLKMHYLQISLHAILSYFV